MDPRDLGISFRWGKRNSLNTAMEADAKDRRG